MADAHELTFSYRPARFKMLALFLLVVAGACLITYLALFNTEGVKFLLSGVRLSAVQVRWLLGIFAALSPLAIVGLGLMVFAAFTGKGRVVIGCQRVVLPKLNRWGLPCGEIVVPLEELVSVRELPFVGKEKMLDIVHRQGRVKLFSNMFTTRRDFDAVADALVGLHGARSSR